MRIILSFYFMKGKGSRNFVLIKTFDNLDLYKSFKEKIFKNFDDKKLC